MQRLSAELVDIRSRRTKGTDRDLGVLLLRPRSPREEDGPLKGPQRRVEPDRGHAELGNAALGGNERASTHAAAGLNENRSYIFIVTGWYWLDVKSPEVALYFVLSDDGDGVAIADAVLVGEPVRPFLAAQEGGT